MATSAKSLSLFFCLRSLIVAILTVNLGSLARLLLSNQGSLFGVLGWSFGAVVAVFMGGRGGAFGGAFGRCFWSVPLRSDQRVQLGSYPTYVPSDCG